LELYPKNLSQQELETCLTEAVEKLDQYLLLVLRIYERVTADPTSATLFRALLEKNAHEEKL